MCLGAVPRAREAWIAAELFKQLTKVDLVHIPYKGSVPALTDVVSGQVQLMFVNTLSAIQYVCTGRLRVLELAEIKEKLMIQGVEVAPSTPEQFSRLIAADAERLGRVAKTAKMRLD